MAGGREGEGANVRNRALALALTVLLLALGAGPSSSKGDPPGDWSRVPQNIRKRLHLSINQIPPYPVDDRRLMNVRSWPKVRVLDGKEYYLEYEAWQGHSDIAVSRVRSLSEIPSGWKYGTYYVRYSKDGMRRATRGPRFMWYPDSTVYEKSFHTPSSDQIWNYDLRGNLRVYVETVHGSGCQPGNSRTESFETDGSLVGFELHRPRKYYWRGRELEWSEYDPLRNKLWKWEISQ